MIFIVNEAPSFLHRLLHIMDTKMKTIHDK